PPTAQIVRMNRKGGPEGVIDAVEALAPDGFTNIDDVMSYQERMVIVRGYASTAGFAREQVNKREVEQPTQRRLGTRSELSCAGGVATLAARRTEVGDAARLDFARDSLRLCRRRCPGLAPPAVVRCSTRAVSPPRPLGVYIPPSNCRQSACSVSRSRMMSDA